MILYHTLANMPPAEEFRTTAVHPDGVVHDAPADTALAIPMSKGWHAAGKETVNGPGPPV